MILSEQLKGTIPVEVSTEIVKKMTEESIIMKYGRRVPMSHPTKVVTVVADCDLPIWTSESKQIKVQQGQIVPVEMKARKLATILLASNEVLNDNIVDVFEALKPNIVEAFSKKIDMTAILGAKMDEKGEEAFSKNLLNLAESNQVTFDAEGLLLDNFSTGLELVEKNNFQPNVFVAPTTMKNKVRTLKDKNDLYVVNNVNNVFNTDIRYTNIFNETTGHLLVADMKYCLVGMLKDIEYEVATQGVVTLPSGEEVNLFQQDMCAMKVRLRASFMPIIDGCVGLVK